MLLVFIQSALQIIFYDGKTEEDVISVVEVR